MMIGGHMGCGHFLGGGAGFMGITGLALIGVVFYAIYTMNRRQSGASLGNAGPGTEDKSYEILRMRYAKGEITDEEYEKAKKVLFM